MTTQAVDQRAAQIGGGRHHLAGREVFFIRHPLGDMSGVTVDRIDVKAGCGLQEASAQIIARPLGADQGAVGGEGVAAVERLDNVSRVLHKVVAGDEYFARVDHLVAGQEIVDKSADRRRRLHQSPHAIVSNVEFVLIVLLVLPLTRLAIG